MFFKVLLAVCVLLVRTFIGIKVSSWLILNLFFEKNLPITDIQNYLIIVLLDIWILGNSVEINIMRED